MKVAFLCQLNLLKKDIGGADIHIQNLLKAMSEIEKLEIHVVTVSKTVKKSIIKIENGITYHILKSPRMPWTITGISIDYRAILRKVININPDIVHAQLLGAPYGLAAMKLCKRYPTVLTAHTLVDMDARNRSGTVKEKIHDTIWRSLERKEINRIPNFIVVSKNIENEMKKRGAQNVHVIPNGISDLWFKVPDAEIEGRILFVGRVIPIKAIENLIQALKITKSQVPKTYLHIVGPTPDKEYKKKLDAMTNKLELLDSILFTGPKTGEELEREYSECSLFVLPSKDESFGIVLLEAMASGKPVVASNVGGIPEIVVNEQEGSLVDYGNPEQLADIIIKLLSDKELRRKMGHAGREKARNYNWNIIAEKTVNYYREIIGDFK